MSGCSSSENCYDRYGSKKVIIHRKHAVVNNCGIQYYCNNVVDWGPWTACTKECDGGTQSRVKYDKDGDITDKHKVSCHLMPCDGKQIIRQLLLVLVALL